MRTVLFMFFSTCALSACDGSYKLTGKVYEVQPSLDKVPIDSVRVSVYIGGDWFRGKTYSDSTGNFSKMDLSTPTKATYYFIFQKAGFRIDTIIREAEKGRAEFEIEHQMQRQ